MSTRTSSLEGEANCTNVQVNLRTDSYGGSPRARTKLMFRILDAIRREFPISSGFCVGIKLNSSDYVVSSAV